MTPTNLTEVQHILMEMQNLDTQAAMQSRERLGQALSSPQSPVGHVSGIYVVNGDGDTVYEAFFACGMRCGTKAPLA